MATSMETTQDVAHSQPLYSDNFNAEDAEVTYESSDGIRFRIHAVYLRAHSEVLAPIPGSTFDEVVLLAEPASVLEILFRFIYPRRQLDLENSLEFDALEELAEVAEKYQVFPAMYASYLQMRATLPSNAIQILAYALKHDYGDIVEEAAPLVLDEPMLDVLNTIPTEFHAVWLKYNHHWREVQRHALTTCMCAAGGYFTSNVVSQVASGLLALHRLDKTFYVEQNSWNGDNTGLDKWKSLVREEIAQIPTLTQLISPSTSNEISQNTSAKAIARGDLQIKAVSGTVFHEDYAALQACAPGLASLGTSGTTVEIPESTITMLLLLDFIRPVRSPNLQSLDFDSLKELALAAEKYKVFQAMQMCRVFMRKALPFNAEEILVFAFQFGYTDILDASAPLTLHTKMEVMAVRLPLRVFPPWAQYYCSWQAICFSTILRLTEGGDQIQRRHRHRRDKGYCCEGTFAEKHVNPIIKMLLENPGHLLDLETLFPAESPCRDSDARRVFDECRAAAKDAIQAIKPMSTYMQVV